MNHVYYADDLCLLSPSAYGLQNLLDICVDYGLDHDIIFNPNKSVCMVFKPDKFKLYCPRVKIDQAELHYVDSVKYLGYMFNAICSDDDDMLRQMRSLYCRSNTILRDFSLCYMPAKMQLFKSYCVTFYCPFMWCQFKVQSYNKLRVAFNNVHRKLLNYGKRDSASQMFVSNGLPNFDAMLRKSVYSFIQRLHKCENQLVQTLLSCWKVRNNSMWNRWNKCLYC